MNNFQAILGKEITNKEVTIFLDSLDGDSIKRVNNATDNFDYELLFKEEGVLIKVSNNLIIAVKVFFSPTPIAKPFRKEFAYGLSSISSENEINNNFNFSKKLNQAPMRADNIYEFENCTVAFDAMTGEINYAELNEY